VQSICPFNNFNSFHCIIIKHCGNVCRQNISAKFDNQPDPMKHFGVMALDVTVDIIDGDLKSLDEDHYIRLRHKTVYTELVSFQDSLMVLFHQ